MEVYFAEVQGHIFTYKPEDRKFHLSSLQARLSPILMSPVSSLTLPTIRSGNACLLLGLCTQKISSMESRTQLHCLVLAMVMSQYLMQNQVHCAAVLKSSQPCGYATEWNKSISIIWRGRSSQKGRLNDSQKEIYHKIF